MNNKTVPKCENCIHSEEPANSSVCIECWSYQRGKNYEPRLSGEYNKVNPRTEITVEEGVTT